MTGLLVVFLVAVAVLTGRIAWIQFVEGKRMTERVRNQLRDSRVLQLPRGTIYDCNGRELAISGLAQSLYANPKEINRDKDFIANLLAPVIDEPARNIKERLNAGNSFIWLKRTLEPEIARQVAELIRQHDIRGLDFIDESKRYYPNDTLAAHVLGFVGDDDKGLDGIEMILDKAIRGERVKQLVETDSFGKPIFKSVLVLSQPKQENNVYLTIDSTIQFIVEQALDKLMITSRAKAATVIVMNPKTGEILAMASRPNYNPNKFYAYSPVEWKNRAVSIIYEPGSTFKPIVAAAALEEGLISQAERFTDNGYIEVSGRRIKNWNGQSYGNVSFADIMKNSINTGMVQLGLRLGAERLNSYARAFGFGRATEINLPGEEEGLLFNSKDMRDSDIATMAIGQSIAVTPIQLLTALSTFANDGVLVKPYLVKEIRNADGIVVSATATQALGQVISPETARIVTELMEKVITEGGGQKAAVKGYRFAGKTGTAEKLKQSGGGYEAGHYIASFAGFGPLHDPRLAALVVVDDPIGHFYGSEVAAPVFSEIMSKSVWYLNIRPQDGAILPKQAKTADKPVLLKQPPKPAPPGKVMVPDVIGKTIREAGEMLNKAGLAFIPAGSGVAVDQSPPANNIVDPGAEITVRFEQR